MNTTLFTPRYLGDVTFDAVVEETHSTTMEITSHPIESGASISDHAFLLPEELIVIGYLSNHEFKASKGENSQPTLMDTAVRNRHYGRSGIVHGSGESRLSAAYEALVTIQRLRKLVTVQTGLMLYTKMAIQSLTVTNNPEHDSSAMFRCELKKLNIVESEHVSRPESSFYKKKNRSSTGKKKAASASEEEKETDNKAQSKTERGAIGAEGSKAEGSKAEERKESALSKIFARF